VAHKKDKILASWQNFIYYFCAFVKIS
jgi:hypothetical protein